MINIVAKVILSLKSSLFKGAASTCRILSGDVLVSTSNETSQLPARRRRIQGNKKSEGNIKNTQLTAVGKETIHTSKLVTTIPSE